jgi:hypothetical protein
MAKEKQSIRDVNNTQYLRKPVRTHIITPGETIAEVVEEYTRPERQPGDILVVSESVVSISQHRAIPEEQIKIGFPARILWRFVRKVPYGTGLRSPSSMQCAINECGLPRILLASAAGALGKLVGRRGDFYRVAGPQAATIDAAHTSPIEPYTSCVILGPKNPDKVTNHIKELTGCEAAVMDINDIGGSWVLAATAGVDIPLLQDIMRDNPMGQKTEQTPVCIVRKVS